MDAIKKKMQAMKVDKDNAMDRADQMEEGVKTAKIRTEKGEEEYNDLVTKSQQLEKDLDVSTELLSVKTQQLTDKEKALAAAEAEENALQRRINALEDDLEKCEEKNNTCNEKLDKAGTAADDGSRLRSMLENKANNDETRITGLTSSLAETRKRAEDADAKYDAVSKQLIQYETDLERASEQADVGESKIQELEEELKVVENNLKSLEVSEMKANKQEEAYKTTIKQLTVKLKNAETRADFADKSVQKLQKEVDRLEDELVNEQEKFKAITDELDQTFAEMSGY